MNGRESCQAALRSARSESRSGYARSSPLLPWWLLILFLLALIGLAFVALTRPHPHALSRAPVTLARPARLAQAGGRAAPHDPLPADKSARKAALTLARAA